jgi:hypothetical protein
MASKWHNWSYRKGVAEAFREHAWEMNRFRESHALLVAGISPGRETGGTYRKFSVTGYWTFIPLRPAPERFSAN